MHFIPFVDHSEAIGHIYRVRTEISADSFNVGTVQYEPTYIKRQSK